MATPQQVVEEFVAAFVAAWPNRDAASVAAFFTADASYHNGPLAPVHGRAGIGAALAEFMAYGGEVAVEMRNLLASDLVVMTGTGRSLRAERHDPVVARHGCFRGR